jgi:hypothetical protein
MENDRLARKMLIRPETMGWILAQHGRVVDVPEG